MAARTTTKTGNASDPTVWNGGTPLADGDSFTVVAPHVLTWDLDISAWLGVLGITIQGSNSTPATLTFPSSGGPYYLKVRDTYTVVGTAGTNKGRFYIGSEASPVPKTTAITFANLTTGTASVFALQYLDVAIWGTDPATKFVRLVNAESVASTQLEIDTDVSSDWAAGDLVQISESPSPSSLETELYTIQSITGGGSPYLTLTGGLGAAKNVGAWVVNVSRNVTLTTTKNSSSGYFFTNSGASPPTPVVIQGAAIRCTGGTRVTGGLYVGAGLATPGHRVGGVWQNLGAAMYEVRGDVSATITNCGSGINTSATTDGLEGTKFSGQIIGCGTASKGPVQFMPAAIVAGNVTGIFGPGWEFAGKYAGNFYGFYGAGRLTRGAIIGGTGGDAQGSSGDVHYSQGGSGVIEGFGVNLRSSVQVTGYLGPQDHRIPLIVLWDVADVNGNPQPGQIAYWSPGGYGKSEAWSSGTHGTPPVPLSFVHKTTFAAIANSNARAYIDIPLLVDAYRPIRVAVYAKKQQNGMIVTPRVELIDPDYNWGHANERLAVATMADDTNWQTLLIAWANDRASPKRVALRLSGAHTSGTLYWNYDLSFGAGCPRPLTLGV